ncbi:MFS transporter [Pseudomonas typographi]|uniref:MFS transporter n=1 Tax=Pseudomonas typographi TaxID=2715964 RepID=A0ABR7Z651_9PSED|nr:MFS transporter [Pseudomonas typographi]MBD1553521.1 MFS transporter [Pseudomonas typographi]MBD1588942.1 MFS transporter [Pseudomonas typographi]MBD1600995.1 MFS transporter [Pseudomonas typographi]
MPVTHAPQRSRHMALLVAAAFFMENLDATVIVTALPDMAASFGVAAIDLNVGITAYVLTLAVFIPASGWVAERWGHRRVFMAALAAFTIASALCGVSQTLGQFVAARVLQGIGGAMMVPVGRLAVLQNTEKKDLLTAIAFITWPGLVAPVLGPPLGGLITSWASWHWIFLLNVPLGLLAMAWAFKLMPAGPGAGQARPFDGLGFVLCAATCAGLLHALDELGQNPARWPPYALLLLSVVLAAWLVRHLLRHRAPLLRLEAVRVKTYQVVFNGGSLFRAMVSAHPFLLPLMFQLGFGLSPVNSGLLVLCLFAGNIGMKPMTNWVLRTQGFRRTLVGSSLVLSAATFACAALTPATPWWLVAPLLVVSGMARSMGFTAYSSLAFADMPAPLMSSANTLFSMAQQLAFGLGVALAVIFLRVAQAALGVGESALAGYHLAFVLIGVMTLASMLDLLRLPGDAGAQVSGHAARRQ